MATPGDKCAPDGSWGFDKHDNALVCQGGFWRYVASPQPAHPFDLLGENDGALDLGDGQRLSLDEPADHGEVDPASKDLGKFGGSQP